ncbi:hypothetical protein [Pseudonocardia sp. TRM90224]|uniref:hypothetical protein n=1 Tax=Pseudonocardia sp. TRM90224 TaxID=2812678 RepID=UPI001E37A9FB|nr:hypothetical protein [Pseudonocardia sp. TRM90224]
MATLRGAALAPLFSALISSTIVVAIVVISQTGGIPAPIPPNPVRPAPAPVDLERESLDRCVAAVVAAGIADRYPPAEQWTPLTRLSTDGRRVIMVDAPVPFVCVTTATTVDVSDPRGAVPMESASLLLSTHDGVLAATATDGRSIEVVTAGGRQPGFAAARYFLRIVPGPINDPADLVAAVGGQDGVRQRGSPTALALPAVHVVDRATAPADTSAYAVDLVRRCSEAGADPAFLPWDPAQVLAFRHDGQPTTLVVARGNNAIGGCAVSPGRVDPIRTWRTPLTPTPGRPFTWLSALPGLPPDVAAGPVDTGVAGLTVAFEGKTWHAAVAGGTFATQLPPWAPTDPTLLVVTAFDAAGTVLYTGPAA